MTLLAAGTTASPAPPSMTDATLGASMPFAADQVTILLRSTAGTGALTASVRLWGFCVVANRWYNMGLLNAGVLIAEADTDLLSHVETVAGLRRFIRLYAEVDAALGGAAAAIEVLAYPVRASAVSH
jgi:hypothetical protein